MLLPLLYLEFYQRALTGGTHTWGDACGIRDLRMDLEAANTVFWLDDMEIPLSNYHMIG